MQIHHTQILGVILAGGQSRRMNNTINHINPDIDHKINKWNLTLGNKTLMDHVIQRLSPQVATIIINGTANELSDYPYPTVGDVIEGCLGPLAGILTGLEYAQQHGFNWLATCPCDTPFFPKHYIHTLSQALENSTATGAVVTSEERMQGVFGLWSVELAPALRQLLETTDQRSIGQWTRQHENTIKVDINEAGASFFNINTAEELEKAREEYAQKIN